MIMTISSIFSNTNIRAVYLISHIQWGNGTDTMFHRTYFLLLLLLLLQSIQKLNMVLHTFFLVLYDPGDGLQFGVSVFCGGASARCLGFSCLEASSRLLRFFRSFLETAVVQSPIIAATRNTAFGMLYWLSDYHIININCVSENVILSITAMTLSNINQTSLTYWQAYLQEICDKTRR